MVIEGDLSNVVFPQCWKRGEGTKVSSTVVRDKVGETMVELGLTELLNMFQGTEIYQGMRAVNPFANMLQVEFVYGLTGKLKGLRYRLFHQTVQ